MKEYITWNSGPQSIYRKYVKVEGLCVTKELGVVYKSPVGWGWMVFDDTHQCGTEPTSEAAQDKVEQHWRVQRCNGATVS